MVRKSSTVTSASPTDTDTPSSASSSLSSRLAKFACEPCRARKQKCGREWPRCKHCERVGRKCNFDDQESVISTLRERVAELETRVAKYQAARQHSARPSPHGGIVDNLILNPAKMREFFLHNRARIGLYFTPEHTQALLDGETSKVSPSLLYATQLVGSMMRLQDEDRFDPHPTLILQLSRTEKSFSIDGESLDVVTQIQIHEILTKFYFFHGDTKNATLHMLRGSHVVMKYGRHLIPSTVLPDGSIDFNEEEISALSQMMFVDQWVHFADARPSWAFILPPSLYAELPLLEAFFHQLNKADCLMAARLDFLQQIQNALLYLRSRTQVVPAPLRMLQTATMFLSFAALMKLHCLTAKTMPESREKMQQILMNVAAITKTFKEDDFRRLCPTVIYVWKLCIHVVRNEAEANAIPAPVVTAIVALVKQSAIMLDSKMPTHKLLDRLLPYLPNTVHAKD
ncbi:hypothetical protein CYLTODRAFT_233828 [Cylindrobasidium torrendii FP15055 ss-10]|uniref:Zn(2)-C6 fungal-type domain-containing protein n=1 Tax=Cylindrobasidium torrendii FP15055 ss-10 TaxID=1314674 RepID=A0A0D7BGE3_9AGAR|nr:hypothetical protein CYLTODRAFT_233828 [Cylindrobasidium torrendii FP15055 ss-10]